MYSVTNRRVTVDGVDIFYREAGSEGAPVLLLLHGFPSASHMFRDLIPRLADSLHLIAPDLPGFGQSAMPELGAFTYTFGNVARLMSRFTDVLGLSRFGMYIFDYGAPVGLRMALADPQRISFIISQNGNAYEEGLSSGWDSLREYWKRPTPEHRESLRAAFTPAATLYQYTQGVPDLTRISPDGYTLDNFYLARPGAQDVQLEFFADYGSNVALYPQFQAYFRAHQPPLLAAWGKNDPYFLRAGAEAFRRDLPTAQIQLFDTGHFALETHGEEIGAAIRSFLSPSARSGIRESP